MMEPANIDKRSASPGAPFRRRVLRYAAGGFARRIAGFLLAATATLLVGSCNEAGQPSSQSQSHFGDSLKVSAVPDQESEDAVISLYNGQIKTTDIYADRIWKYSLKDSSVALNLQVDFYDSAEVITTHLIADSGVILETKHLMTAIGNVIVKNADSSVLLTEELVWNGLTEMITSDSFVTFISDNDTIRGTGLRTNRSMRKVKILHQVSGALGDEE